MQDFRGKKVSVINKISEKEPEIKEIVVNQINTISTNYELILE